GRSGKGGTGPSRRGAGPRGRAPPLNGARRRERAPRPKRALPDVVPGPGTVAGVEVIRLAELREAPLSVDELRAAVSDPGAGGIALFAGVVRDRDDGREVTRLSYSAHPTAAAELRRVAEKVAADFEVRALAAVHRTGDLEIGDLAVVAAVSCAHRAEAFEACRALIDRLKHEVPIWKHQWF